jgi:hypothetical protein
VILDSNPKLRDDFVTKLHKKFNVDDKGPLEWILGMKVRRDRKARTLSMTQELYVSELLAKHAGHLQGLTRRFDTPMADDAKLSSDQCPADGSPEKERMKDKVETYMTVTGALLWLAACTRPDLAFCVSVLARFVSNPAEAHYVAMQRALIYLRDHADFGLHYAPDRSGLVVYSDANWSERLSTSGAAFFFRGCLVAWYSRLQRCVSHSTAEAEFVAASAAAREGIFHREVLADLDETPSGPTPLRLDSKSAIDLTFDAVAFKKTKHILRDAYFLRDVVARLVFAPTHVSSEDELADALTKALGRAVFARLRDLLMGVDPGKPRSRRG